MINLLRNVYAKFEDCFLINCHRKCRVRDRMVVGTMPMPITTKVASSNPPHGKMYLIQHYVINFVSNLRQVCGILQFPPSIKLTATK